MTLLALSGIRKSFGAVDVLHGVDLKVAAGEVVGLVGDNGAGKSTLMKTITGIYRADAGSIAFDGHDILQLDPGERRELGIEMIYQDLSLAKQQDVAEQHLPRPRADEESCSASSRASSTRRRWTARRRR